jgi:hypothetical protein
VDRCEACGFDPAAVTFDDCVQLVEDAPDRWAAAMPAAVSTQAWSPLQYLWHVVDVLGAGAERFWSLTLDPTTTLHPIDPDALAAARRYADQSVVVGIQCLRAAANVWAGAALSCPPDAEAPHSVFGTTTRDDVVRRCTHEVVHHLWDVTPR